MTARTRGFQRALGLYLAQNHGGRRSGKLTPRQRRRLKHKYPDEMAQRRLELSMLGAAMYGDYNAYRGWF